MTEQVFSTYYTSPLGVLLIKATDSHIVQLIFTDYKEADSANHNSPLLTECIIQLEEYFNGNRQQFTLPLQQTGTPFQQRVWHELLTIPCGKTISYLTLAKQLGDPKCIRAAASANGKNQLPILVPCHRVIGSNQSLVGFSGGVWRKKWLLDHENKMVYGTPTLF